jgi:hypothetical protein
VGSQPEAKVWYTSTLSMHDLRVSLTTSQDLFRRTRGGIDTSWLPWTTSPNGWRIMLSQTRRHRQWWSTSSANLGSRGNCMATNDETSSHRACCYGSSEPARYAPPLCIYSQTWI